MHRPALALSALLAATLTTSVHEVRADDVAPRASAGAPKDPYVGHGTLALEAGGTALAEKGNRFTAAPLVGLTAVYIVPLAPRLSLGIGIFVLPLKQVAELGFPARLEWTPVQDWAPFGPGRGSLSLVVRTGVRVVPFLDLSACTDGPKPPPCVAGAGGGVLWEEGIALRSAPGAFDGHSKLRFELGLSALGGPVASYSPLPDGAPSRGLSGGGVMGLGVAY